MAPEQPGRELPTDSPPLDTAAGPSGPPFVLATGASFLWVLVIVGLLALGGWVALAGALVLMAIGLFVLMRFVQRIAWTRKSPERLREGLSGMNEDFSMTDDSHDELSVHDLPPDNPAHQEVKRRLEAEEARAAAGLRRER